MNAAGLARWRLVMGWTKSTAARRLGVSRTTYHRYETGKHEVTLVVALACAALHARLAPIGVADAG